MTAELTLSVDRHVVIVCAEGTFTVTGDRLTGPVTSVEKLETLIEWASGRGLLQPMADNEDLPRVWLVGSAWSELIGQGHPGDSLVEQIGRELAMLVGRGWELKRSSSRFVLSRNVGPQRISVEIMVEPQPWLAGRAGEQSIDPAELGRRLQQWCAVVGALPADSAATSGAALADRIMRARVARKQGGTVVSDPGILPRSVSAEQRIQPAWTPDQASVEQAIEQADTLVWLQQLCPRLASAGMLTLGHGPGRALSGSAAAAAAEAPKRPFGLWHATLPPLDELQLPTMLPAPHPQMRRDQPVKAWLTSQDLDGLSKDIRDGGAGLAATQLSVDDAIVWPHQGRLLEAWATRMREAREAFAADTLMQALVDAAASDYLRALSDAPTWASEGWRQHYQPAWAAAIAAHVRFRGRRAATRISREYHLWPIYSHETGLVYAPVRNETNGETTDLADTHTRLGRLIESRRVELLNDTVLAIILAESPADLAAAITAAVNLDEPLVESVATEKADSEKADSEDAGGDRIDMVGPPEQTEDTSAAATPAATGEAAEDSSGARRPSASATSVAPLHAGSPAAVLHTDGLWLADGTHVDIPEPILHVGQIAELAYIHNLGYQLSAKYAERGQIWITSEACRAFGIDVDSISRRDRAKSLRDLTKGIEFVDLAVAQGWSLGGAADDPDVHRLGTWTRVYRDDKRGVMVALIPGMGDADEMPILADDPTPAQLAARLQLLADALRFPWKINAGVTAVDLMLQTRPKTWSPHDWHDVVHAPSTTEVPFGITDVESDFNWSRPPTDEERDLKFLHGYDRGGSYVAGIAGLELPIGNPVHYPDGTPFNPKTPGYWKIDVPEPGDWRLPYILNPRGLQFTGPKWVCTPRLERAAALGYQPEILEAWVWPQHGRVLLGWYERFRDASTILDIDDPDAQAARNQAKIIRTHGIGIIGSAEYLKGRTAYSPERRLHVMAKANSNIAYRMAQIGEKTGRWPLAASTDTVLYASDDPDPVGAWPGDPALLGRGFGQYKPEASGLLADHLDYLNGRDYLGKQALTPTAEWPHHAENHADGGLGTEQ